MINIKEPKDCCGCNACAQRCPKHCIILTEDHEGFLYPKVNTELCIECGLCEKVCPVINQKPKKGPLEVYAAINPDEQIRKESSSGGIFTLLAEKIIQENGVVFGARFDENWEVRHDYTETIEGLAVFRSSKYVQSRIEDNYLKAEKFLKEKRKVLFSGTPCQIAGLKKFLRKEYDNLLTVDFICHGVPSTKVWRMYLDETCRNLIKRGSSSNFIDEGRRSYIEAINFRHKILGWKRSSFFLKLNSAFIQSEKNTEGIFEPFSENAFMKAFLSDTILRPSCYQCPCKSGKSTSDITIADYWNIQQVLPEFDDDKGISLVLTNTSKGENIFSSCNVIYKKTGYEESKGKNGGFHEKINIPLKREYFFTEINKLDINLSQLIIQVTRKSFPYRIKLKIKKAIKKLIRYQ
ncbi:Coenzyme F420 hydrogenase/dehydrogenase, beta subunit C-terminal domain [Phocaeicola coprocola]|uniref:Coenzyme F420 hydrogenase/dehydrogenase, beta subunit C-terminal domain n=1 Tax=Phocaeicola coprocola TaxID=310298 RepID=UPI003FD894E5